MSESVPPKPKKDSFDLEDSTEFRTDRDVETTAPGAAPRSSSQAEGSAHDVSSADIAVPVEEQGVAEESRHTSAQVSSVEDADSNAAGAAPGSSARPKQAAQDIYNAAIDVLAGDQDKSQRAPLLLTPSGRPLFDPSWIPNPPFLPGETYTAWVHRTKLATKEAVAAWEASHKPEKRARSPYIPSKKPYVMQENILRRPRPGPSPDNSQLFEPIDAGFSRDWSSLRDANLIHLIECIHKTHCKRGGISMLPDMRGVHEGPLRIVLHELLAAVREEQNWNNKYFARTKQAWQVRGDADIGFGAREMSERVMFGMSGMELEARIRLLIPYLYELRAADISAEKPCWGLWRRQMLDMSGNEFPGYDACLREVLLRSEAWPFHDADLQKLSTLFQAWPRLMALLPAEVVGEEIVRESFTKQFDCLQPGSAEEATYEGIVCHMTTLMKVNQPVKRHRLTSNGKVMLERMKSAVAK